MRLEGLKHAVSEYSALGLFVVLILLAIVNYVGHRSGKKKEVGKIIDALSFAAVMIFLVIFAWSFSTGRWRRVW